MIKNRWLKKGSILRSYLENNIVGRKLYQSFFEKLHLLAVAGLNFGQGSDVKSSGEYFVMKWFRDGWKNNRLPTIFDVGANKGEYSLAMVGCFADRCSIYAFEPSKATFNFFCANVQSTSVHPHNFGFSDKDERLVLHSDAAGSGLASVYERKLNISFDHNEEIELQTIDGFCKRENIPVIDFLKLDVEGHELRVLQGAQEMLNKKAIKIIQFEFGGCNIDSRTYFRDFWQMLHSNFDIFRVLKDGLYPIDSYGALDEVFITVNYLATLKE